MGVTSKTVIKIVCDNPKCPGNDLDAKSYDGWIRVTASTQVTPPAAPEVKGQLPLPPPFPMSVTVGEQFFCSVGCSGALQEVLVAAEEARKLEADASLPEPV